MVSNRTFGPGRFTFSLRRSIADKPEKTQALRLNLVKQKSWSHINFNELFVSKILMIKQCFQF